MPKHRIIRLAAPSDQQAWDAYVLAHPDGLAYQLFAWKEAVQQAYSLDCPYFLAESRGQIRGLLPLAHIRRPFSPGSLVSLPYCDAAGILAEDSETTEALLSHAFDYAKNQRIPEVELRLSSTRGQRSEIRDQQAECGNKKVRLLLPLPGSSEALLASFKAKLRSQVKKPARDGLSTTLGGPELLDDFYAVYAQNMRDLGSPAHSWTWFSAILESYGQRARCAVVSLPDATPAAAGIILCHPGLVSIPWASSLRRYNPLNPNMLLYWSFLAYAADNNHSCFDFGRSTPGEGTYKFKTQWGAQPEALHWQRWRIGKNGSSSKLDPSLGSHGRSRALAEGLIQKMPVAVATYLGSQVRKYISL